MNHVTYSIEQAADFLKMSPSAIRHKVRQGKISAYKPAKRLVFLEEDLVSYLKSVHTGSRNARLSSGQEVTLCHYSNAAKPGMSKSQHPTERAYADLLGLKTKDKRRNITTD